MKKMMAVYDTDPVYAERLSDYVNRKEKGIFFAQAFTSREKLMDFAKGNEIDVLLSGEPVDSGEVSGIPSHQKIYLTEDREKRTGQEIYKYQSGDDIIREVMAVYCELPGMEPALSALLGKRKRLIGVFSPVGRCGKTCLALAIGLLLAKEEKVLFVSLDTFTGFTELINEPWKRDLSDLIYYYKLGRFNGIRLNAVTYYLGDLAWLPPIRFPDDYSQITVEGNGGFAAEDPGNQRLRNDGAGRGRLRKAGAAAFRNLPGGLYAGEGRRIFPGEAKGV